MIRHWCHNALPPHAFQSPLFHPSCTVILAKKWVVKLAKLLGRQMIRDWGCNPPFYLPLNPSTTLLFTFFPLAATLFFTSTLLFSSPLWCRVVVFRLDGWKVVNNDEYGCVMECVDWYFFTVDRWLGTNVNSCRFWGYRDSHRKVIWVSRRTQWLKTSMLMLNGDR